MSALSAIIIVGLSNCRRVRNETLIKIKNEKLIMAEGH